MVDADGPNCRIFRLFGLSVSRAGLVGGGAPNQDSYDRSFFITGRMNRKLLA